MRHLGQVTVSAPLWQHSLSLVASTLPPIFPREPPKRVRLVGQAFVFPWPRAKAETTSPS
jgi:hypothetical protein